MDYQKHYYLLLQKYGSVTKPKAYSERHHIVPKCLGGSDEESNLIYLSAESHYAAHQLLTKIYPDHYGLSYAAMLMTRVGKGNERANNKYYSWLKVRFSKLKSELTSEQMKGNSYLKGHVHSEETKAKMSKASLGKPKSEEHRANITKAIRSRTEHRRGWTHSEETKAKIAASNRGRVHSEESKEKMRKPKCKKNQ